MRFANTLESHIMTSHRDHDFIIARWTSARGKTRVELGHFFQWGKPLSYWYRVTEGTRIIAGGNIGYVSEQEALQRAELECSFQPVKMKRDF
jgi:hypothetical protein